MKNEIAMVRRKLREDLVVRGFTDDGETLFGVIEWKGSSGESRQTRIKITFGESFPFDPPNVFLDPLDGSGSGISPTFHFEISRALCLYDRDIAFADDSWGDAQCLLDRVQGWLQNSQQGWPEDSDCDLERYLPRDDSFVTYDAIAMEKISGPTAFKKTGSVIRVLAEPRPRPHFGDRKRSHHGIRLAWVVDLGIVSAPVQSWDDLESRLGIEGKAIERYVKNGSVEFLYLRYQRGDSKGVLVLRVDVLKNGISLQSCESADESLSTRLLRARTSSELLSGQKIAIVGCGAVGSFVAELLFRSGVGRLTLLDPQRLRPGNLIRHAAESNSIGKYKVDAVLDRLKRIGIPTNDIQARTTRLTSPIDAEDLFQNHSIVIDATADARTSDLLICASEATSGQLVSVCLQREGGIARVDRWPINEGEHHLPEVPVFNAEGVRERGCGDFVSMTPPNSVVQAATLAVQVLIDRVSGKHDMPASVIDVLLAQVDMPYDKLGQIVDTFSRGSAA